MCGHALLASLAIAATACGAGARAKAVSTIYVDQHTGNDVTGDGTEARPFFTVSRGLRDAVLGSTVRIGPGTYSPSGSETFPIVVPEGVTLVGDVDNKGEGATPTRIAGSGPWPSPSFASSIAAAMVTRPGSSILGLSISAPGDIAVWCEHPGGTATVGANTIEGSATGIAIAGATNVRTVSNDVRANGEGLVLAGTASSRVRESTFSGNDFGITIGVGATADLGTEFDPGTNLIASNVECDLENGSDGVVDALGNTWDADPFLFAASTSCAAGANVANTGGGAVLFQNIPASSSPVFPGTTLLETAAPGTGAVIPTTQPRLVWNGSGSSYAMAVITTDHLRIQDRRIANPEVMVWAWHSGLPQGNEGDVLFAQGVLVQSGALTSVAPVPLQRGRTYFWAAWAWDEAGLHISASTALGYFTVSN